MEEGACSAWGWSAALETEEVGDEIKKRNEMCMEACFVLVTVC